MEKQEEEGWGRLIFSIVETMGYFLSPVSQAEEGIAELPTLLKKNIFSRQS
jgi:hypothetical protein